MKRADAAKPLRVLLVEDQPTVREAIASEFEPDPDFEVVGQAASLAAWHRSNRPFGEGSPAETQTQTVSDACRAGRGSCGGGSNRHPTAAQAMRDSMCRPLSLITPRRRCARSEGPPFRAQSGPSSGPITELQTATVSAVLDAGASSEVVTLDRHRNARSGLASEHFEHGVARLSVDLDARRSLKGLRVCPVREQPRELVGPNRRGGTHVACGFADQRDLHSGKAPASASRIIRAPGSGGSHRAPSPTVEEHRPAAPRSPSRSSQVPAQPRLPAGPRRR